MSLQILAKIGKVLYIEWELEGENYYWATKATRKRRSVSCLAGGQWRVGPLQTLFFFFLTYFFSLYRNGMEILGKKEYS